MNQILAAIDAQITQLQKARDILTGANPETFTHPLNRGLFATPATATKRPGLRTFTPEQRAAQGKKMKAYWEKRRRAKKRAAKGASE